MVSEVLPTMAYAGSLFRKGYLFRFQVHERAGISLVKLNEMVGKSIISGVKRPKRANRCISVMAVKKPIKLSGFIVHLQQLKNQRI